jgi:hypothetical protein
MAEQEIDDWLREILHFGSVNCKLASKEAKRRGITKKELKAARHRLGVELITRRDPEYGTATYTWVLPEEAT